MAVLCVLLFAVCLIDCCSARIPNMAVVFIFLAGLGYRWLEEGWQGLGSYFIILLCILIILFPLFWIGTIGAGDVKLFAVTGGYLSGRAVICFLIYSMLIAAVFSVIKILRERNGRERFGYLCSYVAEVVKTGHWSLYIRNEAEKKRAGVCLAAPVFLSVLLHLGGVY